MPTTPSPPGGSAPPRHPGAVRSRWSPSLSSTSAHPCPAASSVSTSLRRVRFVITAMFMRELDRPDESICARLLVIRRFKRLTRRSRWSFPGSRWRCPWCCCHPRSCAKCRRDGVGAIFLLANLVIDRTTGGYFDKPAESNPLLHYRSPRWRSSSISSSRWAPVLVMAIFASAVPASAAITVAARRRVLHRRDGITGRRCVELGGALGAQLPARLLQPTDARLEFARCRRRALRLCRCPPRARERPRPERQRPPRVRAGLSSPDRSWPSRRTRPSPGSSTCSRSQRPCSSWLSGVNSAPIVTRLLAGSPPCHTSIASISVIGCSIGVLSVGFQVWVCQHRTAQKRSRERLAEGLTPGETTDPDPEVRSVCRCQVNAAMAPAFKENVLNMVVHTVVDIKSRGLAALTP